MPSQPSWQACWKTVTPQSCARCSLRRRPSLALRRTLAKVALRTSSAVQLQQIEGVQEGVRLVPALAQRREDCQAALIAAHDLAVDQARAHLEVVHRLDDQRV